MVIFSISNKFVDPLRVRDRESPLYLKIRINGLGKYMTFFDGVWYKLIRMENKVELAFKSVRRFPIFSFEQYSKILLWNLLVQDVYFLLSI